MKKNEQAIILVILAVLLAAWMGRSCIRNIFTPGMKFASTELITIDSNQITTVSEQKGNVIIVSCYQTWCIDCARETPVLNQLAATINSPRFKVLYISDETAIKVNSFRQQFASDKILFLHYAGTMGRLGIDAFPTTYLINKKGEVIKTKLEGYDWLQEEETIRELIAE